jgi:putative SOS response-associated peptidase YedK
MQIIPSYWSGSSISFRRSAEVGLSRDKVTDARRGPPGRAEEIEVKPAFREAFQRRRCLVPLDNFMNGRRRQLVSSPMRYRIYQIARREFFELRSLHHL